jgi:hypothetical protein
VATRDQKIKRAAAARALLAPFRVKGAKGNPAAGTLAYAAGDTVRLSEVCYPTLQSVEVEGKSYPLTFRVHRRSGEGRTAWIHVETCPVKRATGAHAQPRIAGRIHVPVTADELVAIAQPRQARETDAS